MKRYGMILADNGSDWYFTGAASDDWPDALLDELKSVPAGAFEAVDASSLMISPNSGKAKQAGVAPAPAPSSSPPKPESNPFPKSTPARPPTPAPDVVAVSPTPTLVSEPWDAPPAVAPVAATPRRGTAGPGGRWLTSAVVLAAALAAFARLRSRPSA